MSIGIEKHITAYHRYMFMPLSNTILLALFILSLPLFYIGADGLVAYEQYKVVEESLVIYYPLLTLGMMLFIFPLWRLYRRCESELMRNHANIELPPRSQAEKVVNK